MKAILIDDENLALTSVMTNQIIKIQKAKKMSMGMSATKLFMRCSPPLFETIA